LGKINIEFPSHLLDGNGSPSEQLLVFRSDSIRAVWKWEIAQNFFMNSRITLFHRQSGKQKMGSQHIEKSEFAHERCRFTRK
jgi:hypothetical protein